MASWDNLVLRIVLPPTLRLLDQSSLQEETTFEVVSSINPWYCSVEQVRLEGGTYVRNLSDITIASMIYQAGRSCDAITSFIPPQTTEATSPVGAGLQHEQWYRFSLARQRYTQCTAARDLILNLWDVNMNRGSKTLGNFSVTKSSQTKDEDVPKQLTRLESEIREWDVVIRTAGRLGRGNRPTATMAAKGKYGVDAPAGRTWMTTGMGANAKTATGFGSTGKPVKFSTTPVISFRAGRYFGFGLSTYPKYWGGVWQ